MTQSDASSQSPRKQRQSRWRYSLRTLLFVMTLLAVWLGIMTHRARQQERAVNVVQSLGGIVAYDFQFDAKDEFLPDALPPGPTWLRQIIGPHFGTNIILVDLRQTGGKATDKDLEALEPLRPLKHLWLGSNAGITDDGLRHIRNATTIETLHLGRTSVSDAGLEHLNKLSNLSYLDLVGCRIDGSGLQHLRHLPIARLNLNRTDISDANLEHVGAMHGLESFMAQNTEIGDDGVAHLHSLTNLRELFLDGSRVTDSGLPHLTGMTKLKSLQLSRTEVTKEGLEELERALPNLPIMSASWPRRRSPPETGD